MFDDTSRLAYLGDQITLWGPRILLAVIVLIATYFAAKAVRWTVSKVVSGIPFFSRETVRPGETLAKSIGTLAYWLVWLFGLLIAMQPLGLVQAMAPINALTSEVFVYAPRILGAALIFFVGLIFARIARNIVETALSVLNPGRLASRLGLCKGEPADAASPEGATAPEGTAAPSCPALIRTCGAIVFTLVIIPVSIAALQTLGISSIVEPTVAVLETVLQAIPRVLAAALLLAIAFAIAQWVRQLVTSTLAALGLDRSLENVCGFNPSTKPSAVAGMITLVAIMLFAAIEAASLLDFGLVAVMLTQATELGGQVIFGSAIILVGVIMGRIVARIVGDSIGESGLPSILKYAVIALAIAIGLRFMGLANEIVNLAFGLILGSAAVACALAFGLGGRETAHQLLQKWLAQGKLGIGKTNPPAKPQDDANP